MDIQTKQILYTRKYTIFCYIFTLCLRSTQSMRNSVYRRRQETQFLKCCKEVIKWDKTATKSHLYTVDTALQESKELLRLAHDLKYSAMNARHYGESCRKLKEIGVMLGELIEEVKTRK